MIEGHTDNKGGDDYNQKLSESRANAVKKYLVDKGVKAERIIAKGFGLSKPIATNDTAEGREKNRRVEFIIRKQDATAPTSDQQKQLEYQKRKEPFTKIPNYAEGEVVTRNYGAEVIQDYPNHEILKYIPSGDSLAWYTDKNLVSYRDDKKEDLKLYLENGNIISKTPSNIKPKVWKYLGKWK
jgi:hypothetical protein